MIIFAVYNLPVTKYKGFSFTCTMVWVCTLILMGWNKWQFQ